jgi:hypothetical protein
MILRRPLAEILTAHPRDLATMIEWAEGGDGGQYQ